MTTGCAGATSIACWCGAWRILQTVQVGGAACYGTPTCVCTLLQWGAVDGCQWTHLSALKPFCCRLEGCAGCRACMGVLVCCCTTVPVSCMLHALPCALSPCCLCSVLLVQVPYDQTFVCCDRLSALLCMSQCILSGGMLQGLAFCAGLPGIPRHVWCLPVPQAALSLWSRLVSARVMHTVERM